MSATRDLLVEIGTEELPPKALQQLSNAFADGVLKGLSDLGLAATEHRVFATPRRLAVLLSNVPEQQADQAVEKRGPAVKAAFDAEGNPSKAAQGFARSCGVDVDSLERMKTDKGEWLVYRAVEPGVSATEVIPGVVEQSLARLPIPKRMRWGAGDIEFVRPVHWIAIVFGETPITCTIMGTKASNKTRGHRFHAPDEIVIEHARDYAALLQKQGSVVPCFEERRAEISRQVAVMSQDLKGEAIVDPDLLDEVTALVELPNAVAGGFDDVFLEIPSEVLITTMQDNQKYFPLRKADGTLMPWFITISNIRSRMPVRVREGNERVVRPRLADAMFFWKQDRKVTLMSQRERLDNVVFQIKLGSLREKSDRVEQLAMHIAETLQVNVAETQRASQLAKCDLMTEMVGEFASLQGVMGEYYAHHDGEPEAVAKALNEQYMPRFASDNIPQSPVGKVLAIAERIDTIVGIFAAGQKPTGVKDPFALRRNALAVLRIIIEGELDLNLRTLLEVSAAALQDKVDAAAVLDDVFGFMLERLKAYYADRDVSPQMFDAVVALQPQRPLDFHHRIEAVRDFAALPEADSLAAANKRIANILRKVDGERPVDVDDTLFVEQEEHTLMTQVAQLTSEVTPLFEAGRYQAALYALAQLKEPVDQYFDKVMVMADDPAIRNNRIALLGRLQGLFMHAADLSRLQS